MLLIFIILSIILTPWFRSYQLPPTPFSIDISSDIKDARTTVDWERGKSQPSIYSFFFLNWPKEILNDRLKIVMENLDIGNYFFSGHPRERVGVVEKQKFLPVSFILFLLGLTSSRLKKYKTFLIVYTISVLLLVFIFKWRSFGETILLSVPIVFINALGMEKLFVWVKAVGNRVKN